MIHSLRMHVVNIIMLIFSQWGNALLAPALQRISLLFGWHTEFEGGRHERRVEKIKALREIIHRYLSYRIIFTYV